MHSAYECGKLVIGTLHVWSSGVTSVPYLRANLINFRNSKYYVNHEITCLAYHMCAL